MSEPVWPTASEVLRLFRTGMDTRVIAERFFGAEANLREADIYNMLHRAREGERQAKVAA